MGRKVVFVLSICGLFKDKCAKFTQICVQRIFKFYQKIFASAGQSTFLQWTLKEVCLSKNWGGINQLQTKLPLISLFSYNSHT